MRAIWKGSLSFILVNIPVKLYSATHQRALSFKSLCNSCHSPLINKRWCPKCEKEVGYKETEKGFKLGRDQYVILDPQDFEKVKLKTTKTIEIFQFVDSDRLPSVYCNQSYWIVPDETGIKAYSLFTRALQGAGKIAIGRLTLHTREHVVAIIPYQNGLLLHTLHYAGEIEPLSKLEELEDLPIPKDEELKLAKELIDRLSKPDFDISKCKDRYTEGLKKIIKDKIEGKPTETKEVPEEEVETVELMDVLKASLDKVKK